MKDLFGTLPIVPTTPSKNLKSILCAEVAVPLPLEDSYSYQIPEELVPQIKIGQRVWIPFKNREMTGYVVGVNQKEVQESKIKPLIRILDPEPVLSKSILDLTRWIADYYACSWGESIENALPKWVKHGKKADKVLANEIPEIPEIYPAKEDFILTQAQTEVLSFLKTASCAKPAKPILIHGVTGSGKSEIYIRMIRHMLDQDKASICLVPEIALTEQIRYFFLHHFGQELEILHSKLADNERFLAWKRLNSGMKRVILGPRSAVFAPVKNLGLIIMDEEHEGTYKQETVPRYHAREVAAWRAKNENALFVMGTATPSLETMRQTEKNEVSLLRLSERVDKKALPEVSVLDLKSVVQDRKKPALFAPIFLKEIEANLQKKEGTMLLLNRRGFSTHIHCPKCGQVENCPSCQVSLTFHQEDDFLLCHYCNFRKPTSEVCGQCGTPTLRFAGFGTEKIESEIAARFPQARIARMDADSVRKKGSHESILKDFRQQKIDILIGTQMIAKGFDFPHVTLVGVVLADVGLMLPDFRSAERTFQLLTQVAGRAGRGKIPGRVYIQTFSPDHPSIRFSKNHDVDNFYKHELPSRYQYNYPPYFRLINIILRSKEENRAYLMGREMREALQREFETELRPESLADGGFEILGPAPLPFYKLRGQFRWHLMLKFRPEFNPTLRLKKCLGTVKKSAQVAYAIDVDPLSIL